VCQILIFNYCIFPNPDAGQILISMITFSTGLMWGSVLWSRLSTIIVEFHNYVPCAQNPSSRLPHSSNTSKLHPAVENLSLCALHTCINHFIMYPMYCRTCRRVGCGQRIENLKEYDVGGGKRVHSTCGAGHADKWESCTFYNEVIPELLWILFWRHLLDVKLMKVTENYILWYEYVTPTYSGTPVLYICCCSLSRGGLQALTLSSLQALSCQVNCMSNLYCCCLLYNRVHVCIDTLQGYRLILYFPCCLCCRLCPALEVLSTGNLSIY
jgi:hypothetical protein